MTTETQLLRKFLHGEIDNGEFHHIDHLRLGFAIVRRHPFPEAAAAFCAALKLIAAQAGKPAAYHETISIAFLSVIAERNAAGDHPDFESFARDNDDLLEKSALERWYTRDRLHSDIARTTFLLPGPIQ